MRSRKVKISINGTTVAVTGLYHDSRQVQPGGLFFALRDNTYVNEAIKNGASVIVTSDITVTVPSFITKIYTPNVRLMMALVAKEFYGNVVDKMRITGVIGTNGKTTTTYILRHILEMATGKNVGVIGTTGVLNAGKTWDGITNLTTPDPIDLHRAIACMYQNGVRDVVMEVSAHAIFYDKVAGINFTGVIFTNITQDHLDFFGTFEKYKNTKLGFFERIQSGFVVVNGDDKYSSDVVHALEKHKSVNSLAYGLKSNENIGAKQWSFVNEVNLTVNGSDFILPEFGLCHLSLPGLYNVYNAVAAALLCRAYEVPHGVIRDVLTCMMFMESVR